MKLTKETLKQLIKEELESMMEELDTYFSKPSKQQLLALFGSLENAQAMPEESYFFFGNELIFMKDKNGTIEVSSNIKKGEEEVLNKGFKRINAPKSPANQK